MKAYHFLKADMRSGEGHEPPWTMGETRTVSGAVELCIWGYHSSPTWFDALRYAPGPVACVVDVPAPEAGNKEGDKQVTATRTLVAARNVEREMRLWLCDVAEDVLPAFERRYPDDKRPRGTIEVARRYADGRATKEELGTAWYAVRAAWDAARDAVRAAWAPAWAAARAAAREPAWAAARDRRFAAKYAGWFNARMDAVFAEEKVRK